MSQKSILQLDKNNGLSMDFNFPCNRGSAYYPRYSRVDCILSFYCSEMKFNNIIIQLNSVSQLQYLLCV